MISALFSKAKNYIIAALVIILLTGGGASVYLYKSQKSEIATLTTELTTTKIARDLYKEELDQTVKLIDNERIADAYIREAQDAERQRELEVRESVKGLEDRESSEILKRIVKRYSE